MADIFNIGDEVAINMPYTQFHDVVGIVIEKNEWEDEDEEYDEDEDEYITTPRWVVEYKVQFLKPIVMKFRADPLPCSFFEDRYLKYHETKAKITEPSEDIYNDLI